MKKILLVAVVLAAFAPAALARVRAVRHPAEACSYSLAPTWGATQIDASGLQRGVVLVFGQTALCSQWLAYSPVAWITVEAAPGDGQPAAYVTVAANTTPQVRTAALTVAGVRLDVTQSAAPATVTPPSSNRVQNGTFNTNLANWGWNRPVNGTGTASWSTLDANGNPASGSMLLRGNAGALAYQQLQCIPASRSTPYLFGAKVRTSDTSDRGEAFIALFSYQSADCSGDYTKSNSVVAPPMRPEPGPWQEFTFAAVTGSRTQSILLVIGSAANVNTFDTWFDDVFVKP